MWVLNKRKPTSSRKQNSLRRAETLRKACRRESTFRCQPLEFETYVLLVAHFCTEYQPTNSGRIASRRSGSQCPRRRAALHVKCRVKLPTTATSSAIGSQNKDHAQTVLPPIRPARCRRPISSIGLSATPVDRFRAGVRFPIAYPEATGERVAINPLAPMKLLRF